MEYTTDCDADVILLQETWLNIGDKSIYSQIKNDYGYAAIKKMRAKNRGGGLAILFKPNVKVKQVYLKMEYQTFEYVMSSFRHEENTVKLVNLYRRPYSEQHRCTEKMFLKDFGDFLNEVYSPEEHLILLGDFNLNMSTTAITVIRDFTELLHTFNLVQLVTDSTHIKDGILDLLIVPIDLSIDTSTVVVDKMFKTDHYPVHFSLGYKKPQITQVVKYVREYDNIDMESFRKDLVETISCYNKKQNKADVDHVDVYNTILIDLINKHCSLRRKVYRHSRKKSKWFNNRLQQLKAEKRKAERLYKKHNTEKLRQNYTKARNIYNTELENTRSNFYQDTLTKHKNNPKKLFNTLNSLTGNKEKHTQSYMDLGENAANELADFFLSKVENIRNCIPVKTTAKVDDDQKVVSSINKKEFTKFDLVTHEVLKVAMSAMKNKTCSLDPAPTNIVKECFSTLSPMLLEMINSSFDTARFPESLKRAVITPIVKDPNKDTTDPKKYKTSKQSPFSS